MNVEVPQFTQAFTANGDASGVITVADSSGFYPGAIGFLIYDDGGARCIVVSVPSATTVGVRIIADDNTDQMAMQIYGGKSDLAAYTTAKHAALSMPSQLVRIDPSYTGQKSRNV